MRRVCLTQSRRSAEPEKQVLLGDVCEVVYGDRIRKKDSVGGDYPVYGGGGETFRWATYNRENKCIVSRFAMSNECVRFVKGKFFLNDSGLTVDSSDAALTQVYLDWFLFGSQDKIYALGQGAAQKNLSISRFLALEIPLPSIDEQKRIAAVLDKICELKKNAETRLEKLDTLVKSRFVEMFRDESEHVRVRDVVAKKIGRVKTSFAQDAEIRYIDISAVDRHRHEIVSFATTTVKNAPSRAQQCILKGDIIVSSVRPNLSNIAQLVWDGDNYVASSGFCVLRAEGCEPLYLRQCVLEEGFTEAMTKVAKGANYPAVSDSDILDYRIPSPPLVLQREFSAFVEKVDDMKAKTRALIDKLNLLYRSKLQEFFG